MRKVTKHVFETSDGKAFDIKEEAEKHQAWLDVADFFGDMYGVPDGDITFGENAATVLLDNLDAFAEIIRPLIRKPRAAKAKADEYEAMIGSKK